jgi:hypothetical protein
VLFLHGFDQTKPLKSSMYFALQHTWIWTSHTSCAREPNVASGYHIDGTGLNDKLNEENIPKWMTDISYDLRNLVGFYNQ